MNTSNNHSAASNAALKTAFLEASNFSNSANNAAIASAGIIALEKVAADYKLLPTESFLTHGRKNAQHPNRPYYHTVLRAPVSSMPALPELDAATLPAFRKLWEAATLELLKEKAAPMEAGSKVQLAITATDITTFILEMGNRERQVISGEEFDEFAASYAFTATALVHNWTPAQVAKVAVALRQYAAPGHRKQQADASILQTRLSVLPSILTGDDTAMDADILRIYNWLTAKLNRDIAAVSTSLIDSI